MRELSVQVNELMPAIRELLQWVTEPASGIGERSQWVLDEGCSVSHRSPWVDEEGPSMAGGSPWLDDGWIAICNPPGNLDGRHLLLAPDYAGARLRLPEPEGHPIAFAHSLVLRAVLLA